MLFDLIKYSHKMKRIKLNLAILAVLIGTGAAFAAQPKAAFATEYGYDQSSGTWILTRAGSHCTVNPQQNCKAQFNGDPNNGGTIVPGTLEKGNFVY
jgi:hypothetical protein